MLKNIKVEKYLIINYKQKLIRTKSDGRGKKVKLEELKCWYILTTYFLATNISKRIIRHLGKIHRLWFPTKAW
jgi:hypothetical protein